jgi:hypothetical protein
LQRICARESEPFHLIAYLDDEGVLRVAASQVGRGVENLCDDLASPGKFLGADREGGCGEMFGQMAFDPREASGGNASPAR